MQNRPLAYRREALAPENQEDKHQTAEKPQKNAYGKQNLTCAEARRKLIEGPLLSRALLNRGIGARSSLGAAWFFYIGEHPYS